MEPSNQQQQQRQQQKDPEQIRARAQQHDWSFCRMGADTRAQAISDTWDELQSVPLPILQRLTSRHRDLYKAELGLLDATQSVFANHHTTGHETPTTQGHTMSRKGASRTAAATKQAAVAVLEIIKRARRQQTVDDLFHPQEGVELPPFEADAGGGDDDPGFSDSDAVVYLRLRQHELEAMQRQLEVFVKGSRQLVSHCEAVIKTSNQAQAALSGELDAIRSFITTIWSTSAQTTKAFPPFFDLGPLDASLYGIGHTQPPPPVPTPAARSSSAGM